jgi:hypothetical protein
MGTGSKGVVGVPPPLLVEVAPDVIRGLRPAAARRGLSVAALVHDLLDVVAMDKLTDAILDDVDLEP